MLIDFSKMSNENEEVDYGTLAQKLASDPAHPLDFANCHSVAEFEIWAKKVSATHNRWIKKN